MPHLLVKRKIRFPSFGAAKWRKSDHSTPLELQLEAARTKIFLEEDQHSRDDFIILPEGRLELVYDPAPRALIRSIQSRGAGGSHAAERIHTDYAAAYRIFEALLYSHGRARNMMGGWLEPIHRFFSDTGIMGSPVEWSLDGSAFATFEPNLPKPRGKNPLYSSAQLVTPARWRSMQDAAANKAYPEGELFELYRIRAKTGWRDSRTAAIEASIVSEALLREYGEAVLRHSGFSKNKLKRLHDELSFNNLLNVVLPLSLKKTELRRVQGAIDSVDRLRRIRNDLVHGNLPEQDLDEKEIEAGVDGAIRLVQFLQEKLGKGG